MDATSKPYSYTAVTGTGAVAIIPASGQSNRYCHLVSLIITTQNVVAGTLTLSDGTNTVATFDFPNSAAAPKQPFVLQLEMPLQQSVPNLAWTLTASANASGYHCTAQYACN
jgi:hypothetical protein